MYSTDRHEEQVAAQQGEGWRVAEDTHAAPEPVAGEPPAGPGPSGDARDPQSLVNDGEDA
jgi:hypothetical protein